MRATVLFTFFLLFFQLVFAAVPVPAPVADSLTVRSPQQKGYEKGQGTVGFITGLVLGPLGLLAVHLLSHNRTQRKRAMKGFTIWAMVMITAAFIWLIVFAAAGKHSGKALHGTHLGNSSSFGGASSGSQANKKPSEEELSKLPLFLQP